MTRQLRITTVIGTRPELIKIAPVIRAMQAAHHFSPQIWLTGQHTEMLAGVLPVFSLQADKNLKIGRSGSDLASTLSGAISRTSEELAGEQPDALLVQGDTSSALGAGLAAFLRQIPVIHLEAGLRTGDLANPFPEEANRKLLASVSSLHLAPTINARKALEHEGINPKTIVVTGNTVIDALCHVLAARPPARFDQLFGWIRDEKLVVVTAHRRESWDDGIDQISKAIGHLAKLYPQVRFVFSMHRNPKVRDAIMNRLVQQHNIALSEPIPYDVFAHLLKKASIVITDSGGIQEEATFLGTPLIVVRDKTERVEAGPSPFVVKVGVTSFRIIEAFEGFISNTKNRHLAVRKANHVYGDGHASGRVLDAITRHLSRDALPDDFVPHHDSVED